MNSEDASQEVLHSSTNKQLDAENNKEDTCNLASDAEDLESTVAVGENNLRETSPIP